MIVPKRGRGPARGIGTDSGPDDGRAIIEVVFLAVLVLIPVVYLLLFLLRVQAGSLAVAQAAREAGRVLQTSTDPADGLVRAERAARFALADQDISDNDLSVSFVDGAGDCSLPPIVPVPLPGATFTVCVTVSVVLPGIPGILSGEKNTVTGAYVIHLDELRENG